MPTREREDPRSPDDDAESLERELSLAVRGQVRFDDGSRALYATDASNYRQVPIGVVLPESAEDAIAAIEVCRRFGAPVLTRGAGTSLAGQCCNVAVVLDFSRHVHRVLAVDPEKRLARVEPGAVLDDLRGRAERQGLTFGPDPATHAHCTLGGMIGNDSCGVHSVLAAFEGEGGRTADNVAELEIATYDGARMRVGRTSEEELARIIVEGGRRGEIYQGLAGLRDRYAEKIREKFPKIPRRVSGYNLPALLPENGFHVARALVGSEGTCVAVLEATVHLIPSHPFRVLLVAGFSDVFAAADAVPAVLAHRPAGLEGFDDGLVNDMRRAGLHPDGIALLPEGGGWLLAELGGASPQEAEAKARRLMEELSSSRPAPAMRLYTRPTEARRVWQVRESALPATAHAPGRPLTWEGWEDSAVAPERLGAYLRDQRRLWERHGYRGDLYGHFGDGCVHTRLDFDFETPEGIRRFRAFLEEAADLVLSYGGSLSGEHGDGQSRSELLPKMFGPELAEAFRQFKRLWDPDGKMNPGKLVDPYPIVSNLRLSGGRPGRSEKTVFRFPEDGGDLSRAALRCVGVGKCRRLEGGTMCPSFRATLEEAHSTRGRARLLFEMLQGETIRGGWKSEQVREALDLCLACKACKSECPVGVDMATYKAEFLSHYYQGRRRPRSASAFGWIHRWARAASFAPGLVNFLTQTPGLSRLTKAAAGIAPERQIPLFSAQSFRGWFRRRPRPPGILGRRPVLLWPDTFNDFFHPGIARAAVEVLEAAGFAVEIPERDLCCGRPLYDFGMLDPARHLLREILGALATPLRQGVPVVVLEPSCAAVFRDELPNLFPEEEDARLLSRQTHLLAGFLGKEAPGFAPGSLSGNALLQAHCHQQALFGTGDDEALLGRVGLDFRILDAGCCGMAGAFGFERGKHYEVSVRCAERVLAPEVRRAPADTLILADGFSCREQIRQLTGRRALHTAELLRSALDQKIRSTVGSGPGSSAESTT
ncbi:MAG: FAD-binding and (Fe-S)-binding domain-containing protein [Thermoanaerobaculia bacterium]